MADNQNQVPNTTEAVQQPKKPNKKKKWIIIGVVFVVLILIVALFGGEEKTKTTTTEDENGNKVVQSETVSEDTSFKTGETYKDSYCSITMTAVNTNFTDYSEWADVPSGKKVIQATFDFENVGTNDFLADAYSFDCYADGESCEDFFETDDSGFMDTLSAGKKATGRHVYFLVPENATKITLEFETNWISDDRVEFIVAE